MLAGSGCVYVGVSHHSFPGIKFPLIHFQWRFSENLNYPSQRTDICPSNESFPLLLVLNILPIIFSQGFILCWFLFCSPLLSTLSSSFSSFSPCSLLSSSYLVVSSPICLFSPSPPPPFPLLSSILFSSPLLCSSLQTADSEDSCGDRKVSQCGAIKCTYTHQSPKHHNIIARTHLHTFWSTHTKLSSVQQQFGTDTNQKSACAGWRVFERRKSQ